MGADRLDILRSLVNCEPEDADELWDYMAAQFGMKLIREAVCSGHSAQLDALWSILKGEYINYLLVTNRHGGKTYSLAALMVGMCLWRPGLEVSVMSGCIAPWTGVVVRVSREGKRNGVYVLPAVRVMSGDEVWTLSGWRKVLNVGRSLVDEICGVRSGLGLFCGTVGHEIYSEQGNGVRRWRAAGEIRNMVDYSVFPLRCNGESLLGGEVNGMQLPDPEVMGLAACLCSRRRDDMIEVLMPSERDGGQRRTLEAASAAIEALVEVLREQFGVSRVWVERFARFYRVVRFPANEMPGALTVVPLGLLAGAPREWRLKFLQAYAKYGYLILHRKSISEEEYKLAVPNDASQYYLPSRIKTGWDKVLTISETISLLGLDCADISAYYATHGDIFPRRSVEEDGKKRSSGLKIKRLSSDFKSGLFEHPVSFSRLSGDYVVRAMQPAGFTSTKILPARVARDFYFVDIEVDGADNFLTTSAGIVHNSKMQTSRWEGFFRKVYTKPQFNLEFSEAPTHEGTRFKNGSGITLLASSETSARSPHSNIVVMEEADAIRRNVFEAGQFAIDMTEERDSIFIGLSTFHRAGGNVEILRSRLSEQTDSALFEWCIRETIAPCNADLDCNKCDLFEDCGGLAKRRKEGFLDRRKLLALKSRVSAESWAIEERLQMPKRDGMLFEAFSASFPWVQNFELFKQLYFYRGFDHGNRTAVVWAQYDPNFDRIWVVDSMIIERIAVPRIIEILKEREYTRMYSPLADSWGDARSGQIHLDFLAEGISIRTAPQRLRQMKIEALRKYLDLRADGMPGLVLHSRNKRLIQEIADVPRIAELTGKREYYEKLKRIGGFDLFDALMYLVDGVYYEISKHPVGSLSFGSLPVNLPPSEPFENPMRKRQNQSDISIIDLPDTFGKPLDPEGMFDRF